jgi:Mn-dependent DtxR family transcriptional regulator
VRRSRDYREGEAEGLRRAADLVRELERTVAERLDLPSGRVTREARKVRHKAFQVAAKRIETVMRKHRGSARDQVEAQLKRLGLD